VQRAADDRVGLSGEPIEHRKHRGLRLRPVHREVVVTDRRGVWGAKGLVARRRQGWGISAAGNRVRNSGRMRPDPRGDIRRSITGRHSDVGFLSKSLIERTSVRSRAESPRRGGRDDIARLREARPRALKRCQGVGGCRERDARARTGLRSGGGGRRGDAGRRCRSVEIGRRGGRRFARGRLAEGRGGVARGGRRRGLARGLGRCRETRVDGYCRASVRRGCVEGGGACWDRENPAAQDRKEENRQLDYAIP